MSIMKVLPYVNFAIATTALGFQITVLYPWHMQLERDFDVLKTEQENQLRGYHEQKILKLGEIENKIEQLNETLGHLEKKKF